MINYLSEEMENILCILAKRKNVHYFETNLNKTPHWLAFNTYNGEVLDSAKCLICNMDIYFAAYNNINCPNTYRNQKYNHGLSHLKEYNFLAFI